MDNILWSLELIIDGKTSLLDSLVTSIPLNRSSIGIGLTVDTLKPFFRSLTAWTSLLGPLAITLGLALVTFLAFFTTLPVVPLAISPFGLTLATLTVLAPSVTFFGPLDNTFGTFATLDGILGFSRLVSFLLLFGSIIL